PVCRRIEFLLKPTALIFRRIHCGANAMSRHTWCTRPGFWQRFAAWTSPNSPAKRLAMRGGCLGLRKQVANIEQSENQTWPGNLFHIHLPDLALRGTKRADEYIGCAMAKSRDNLS